MTANEAIARVDVIWGHPATALWQLIDGRLGTPPARSGETEWRVEFGPGQLVHGLDPHGHVTCGHVTCLRLEEDLNARNPLEKSDIPVVK